VPVVELFKPISKGAFYVSSAAQVMHGRLQQLCLDTQMNAMHAISDGERSTLKFSNVVKYDFHS
jgi:hypothetical protein